MYYIFYQSSLLILNILRHQKQFCPYFKFVFFEEIGYVIVLFKYSVMQYAFACGENFERYSVHNWDTNSSQTEAINEERNKLVFSEILSPARFTDKLKRALFSNNNNGVYGKRNTKKIITWYPQIFEFFELVDFRNCFLKFKLKPMEYCHV